MARLVLHIGQFKTGTTTIQTMLAEQADRMAEEGFLYPQIGKSREHWQAVGGLFLHSPATMAASPEYKRRQLDDDPERFRKTWTALSVEARDWAGDVVLSSESLCLARPSLVSHVRREFPNHEISVVVGVRPLSRLLPSWYQELAKRSVVDDFEGFARSALRQLLAGHPTEFGWMSVGGVRQVWDVPDVAWHQIGGASVEIGDIIPEVVRALGGRVCSSPPRTNPTMSRLGLEAWQRYVTLRRPRHMRVAVTSRERVFRAHPECTDKSAGGGFALLPAISELVDECFPVSGAASASARRELAAQLDTQRAVSRDEMIDPSQVDVLSRRMLAWDRILGPVYGAVHEARRRVTGVDWPPPIWADVAEPRA